MHNLKSKLMRINNCKYSLYCSILGEYHFDKFTLRIDHIQADPFAPPSKITVIIPLNNTQFPKELFINPVRSYSFCDAVGRIVAADIRKNIKEIKGSGNSGFCGIRYGAQKVIEGNAVIINNQQIEIRILAGMPAFGRNISGKEAQTLLLQQIPALIENTILNTRSYHEELLEFVRLTERQTWLREECRKRNLCAFVADGSILARASSISDKPMSSQKAVPFYSPKELSVSITLPDGFVVKGMGIPHGITLITGGGFHGKSTLLSALADAVYNHIPGDGREFVVTDDSAVFLRAEDGRFVQGTDISPFIHNLPGNKSSHFFQTENASGSSSQAANLVEALEMGSRLMLIDEDISATNFLIKDQRMRLLVPDAKETIIPLISHLKFLKKQGVSVIMVSGALGDFLNTADHVIAAENYSYHDVSSKARKIASDNPISFVPAHEFSFASSRIVSDDSVSYIGKKGGAIIDGEFGLVKIGRQVIDLSAWKQLYDFSQFGTIAAILSYAKLKGYYNQKPEMLWKKVNHDLEQYGWDILSKIGFDHFTPRQESRKHKQSSDQLSNTGNWRYIVKTRPIDWHAALSRLRTLNCSSCNIDKL
ncbi:MAG: P-loop domain-containing protein [Brevinemataceae bacterium]